MNQNSGHLNGVMGESTGFILSNTSPELNLHLFLVLYPDSGISMDEEIVLGI